MDFFQHADHPSKQELIFMRLMAETRIACKSMQWTHLVMRACLLGLFLSSGCVSGGYVAPSSPSLAIGQRYGGGIIFYLDASRAHGLIAAPSDQGSSIGWFNGSDIVTGATGTSIGTGQANTAAIVKAQGNGSYAAILCDQLEIEGFNDWFLPSKDELNALYDHRADVGGFTDDFYWSSSEQGVGSAWEQAYNTGTQYHVNKNALIRIRSIRAF